MHRIRDPESMPSLPAPNNFSRLIPKAQLPVKQIEDQSIAVVALREMLDVLEDSSRTTEGTAQRTKTIADTLTALTHTTV